MPAPGPGGERHTVYSTDTGRVCPDCGRSLSTCTCRQTAVRPKLDGIVRVYRDRRRRRGKTVTTVEGVPGGDSALEILAGTLKRLCGSGGTVKDGVIEIQGDHRDVVAAKLTELGYRAKLAGG